MHRSLIMLRRVQQLLCWCCYRNKENREDSEHILKERSNSTYSGCAGPDVPFTIPNRKVTPNGATPSEDDSISPGRSRSSTVEYTNTGLVGVALGELDASLYSGYNSDDSEQYPDTHLGRLWYTIAYNAEDEALKVNVIKARHLPLDKSGETPKECFMRIYLLPDEKRFIQTKRKKQQCDPDFNEEFTFQLPQDQLNQRSLRFTVYQTLASRYAHRGATRMRAVGHATVPLGNHHMSDDLHWIDLAKELVEVCGTRHKGKILLSLHYNSLNNNLYVGVYRCLELAITEPTDIRIKMELFTNNRRVKSKSGSICPSQEADAEINQSFKFKLSPENMDSSSVCITVLSGGSNSEKGVLGRVVLGGYMLATGKEMEQWVLVTQTYDEQIIQWQDLC